MGATASVSNVSDNNALQQIYTDSDSMGQTIIEITKNGGSPVLMTLESVLQSYKDEGTEIKIFQMEKGSNNAIEDPEVALQKEQERMKEEEERKVRSAEFLVSCGKWIKGGKGPNLDKAMTLYSQGINFMLSCFVLFVPFPIDIALSPQYALLMDVN